MAFMISNEKSAVKLIYDYFYMMNCFYCYFQDIPIVFGFQHFDDNVSRHAYPWVYYVWSLICKFINFGIILAINFFNYVLTLFLSPLLQGLLLCICWVFNVVPQVSYVLFFLSLYFIFFLLSKLAISSSLIIFSDKVFW